MCNPLGAIRGEHVDVVIVGGIGGGALRKLQAVGIAVMAAQSPTLGEIIAEYNSGPLHEINPEMACTHGHGTPAATGDAFSFAPFTGVRIRRVPGIHGDAGTGVSSIIGSSSPVWSSGAASGPRQGSRPHAPSTADGVTPGPRRWFWPRPL